VTRKRLWFLYVLQCADGTLYTGITTDPARRLKQHNAGRGASYTKARRPVELAAVWRFDEGGRGHMLKVERRFKKLRRARKLAAISGGEDWGGGVRIVVNEPE
jgi:putative endonuclease